MANLGFYLLAACGIFNFYGAVANFVAARTKQRALWLSARRGLSVSCVLCIAASLILWSALLNRDFSIAYVFKNSSKDLPFLYSITAFWSSLEGSHMLWTLFMQICAVVCAYTYARHNEHIMPYAMGFLQLVLAWMFYLACTHSDVFALQVPQMAEGRGMNTLLQNPYMAIHPPLLFTGYTTLAIPYAYSMAALCYGDVTEGWVATVRRWTLVAWCFLTAAIILGGRWAYVELGWAGYWAWDPVENSSLLPWLFATALLHCFLIQANVGHMKRLSFVLAIMAFFMTFFGTFVTRSGVITSVHSFAESPIGPAYLGFLAALLLVSCAVYGFRAHLVLPPDTDKAWGASKESALVVTLLLVLSFAAIVFVGTIFPIISEALTQRRISIQAPYFNSFAPYFGLITALSIAVGNLMRYRRGGFSGGWKTIWVSGLLGAVVAVFFYFVALQPAPNFSNAKTSTVFAQIIGVFALAWSACCLVWDLRLRAQASGLNFLVTKQRAYLGGLVAHLGFLLILFGFLGNYRGLEQEFSLNAGENKSLWGYEVSFRDEGMFTKRQENVELFVAPLDISKDGRQIAEMQPARSRYPTSNDLLHEIAVSSTLWRDLYVVLRDFDRTTGKRVTVQFHLNPTVRFVWIATILMVLGGLLALSDGRIYTRTRDVLT